MRMCIVFGKLFFLVGLFVFPHIEMNVEAQN